MVGMSSVLMVWEVELMVWEWEWEWHYRPKEPVAPMDCIRHMELQLLDWAMEVVVGFRMLLVGQRMVDMAMRPL